MAKIVANLHQIHSMMMDRRMANPATTQEKRRQQDPVASKEDIALAEHLLAPITIIGDNPRPEHI